MALVTGREAPGALGALIRSVLICGRRHRSHGCLAEQDIGILKGTGVSRIEGREEASRWDWQP